MTDHKAHQRCWNCLYFRLYDNMCLLPEESKNEPEPVCPSDSGCGCWEDNPVASWQIVSKILGYRDKYKEPELIEKLDSVHRRVDAIVSELNDLQLYAETLRRDLEIMIRNLDEKGGNDDDDA
jgi:hypothetical protein